MPTIDHWRALREALDALRRIESLHDCDWQSREGDVNEWGTQCYEIDCVFYGVDELATAYDPETAAYIAAAHPAAIRSLLDERDRLATDRAVLVGWIKDAMPWIQGQQSLYPNHELGALCESGRRLVDGGPDDLLAGVE